MVVCKSGSSVKTVEHFYNQGYYPILIDSASSQIGLSQTSVTIEGTKILCKFTRDNSNPNSKYVPLSIDNPPYFVIAFGKLSPSSGKSFFF